MTEKQVEKIEEFESDKTEMEKEQTDQTNGQMTTSEMLFEYVVLVSQFNSLTEEEKDRLGDLHNFMVDTTDNAIDMYGQTMLVANVLGEFLYEKEIYEEFEEYYVNEVSKRMGIAEGLH